MMKRKFLIFPAAFSFFLLSGLVHAADITVTLPGTVAAETANPGGWVSALYRFSLMAAGMLAFGMIVYAGLRYTFAAGNPSTQSDARDQILQALLGLLLLFGAFIVLTTINPNLTNLTLPELGKVKEQGKSIPGQDNNNCENSAINSCGSDNACTCSSSTSRQCENNGKQKGDPNYVERFICK